jgi:hypothetical protein
VLDLEDSQRISAGFAKFGGVEATIGHARHEDFSDSPYLSRRVAFLGRRPDGHVCTGVELCERMMNSDDVAPPLAANMSAAFKKVRGAIDASDPLLTDVTRIVELAKDGVDDIEELSSRTLSSLKTAG